MKAETRAVIEEAYRRRMKLRVGEVEEIVRRVAERRSRVVVVDVVPETQFPTLSAKNGDEAGAPRVGPVALFEDWESVAGENARGTPGSKAAGEDVRATQGYPGGAVRVTSAMGLIVAERCEYVGVSGRRCGERAGRNGRCERHERWSWMVPAAMGMPCPEDEESVQAALMQTLSMLLAGRIKPAAANAIARILRSVSSFEFRGKPTSKAYRG